MDGIPLEMVALDPPAPDEETRTPTDVTLTDGSVDQRRRMGLGPRDATSNSSFQFDQSAVVGLLKPLHVFEEFGHEPCAIERRRIDADVAMISARFRFKTLSTACGLASLDQIASRALDPRAPAESATR